MINGILDILGNLKTAYDMGQTKSYFIIFLIKMNFTKFLLKDLFCTKTRSLFLLTFVFISLFSILSTIF